MMRYDRQIKVNNFGTIGQDALEQATFLIIGIGALGSTIAELLTRAGAMRLIICDMDVVEMTNLHRQSGYNEAHAMNAQLKVDALKDHLNTINSNTTIISEAIEVNGSNIIKLLTDHAPTIVMDGTDQLSTRFLINEACQSMRIPWVYGACLGTQGTVMGIHTGTCLSCIFNRMPTTGQDCSITGILPTTAHMTATLQVQEAFHMMRFGTFSDVIINFDLSTYTFNKTKSDLLKDDECNVCVHHNYTFLNTMPSSIQKLCGGKYLFRLSSDLVNPSQPVKRIQKDHYNMSIYHNGHVIVEGLNRQEALLTIKKYFNY